MSNFLVSCPIFVDKCRVNLLFVSTLWGTLYTAFKRNNLFLFCSNYVVIFYIMNRVLINSDVSSVTMIFE